MITLKEISDEQLLELDNITSNAAPPDDSHSQYIALAPGISRNASTRFDSNLLKLTPLGLLNNPILLNWLESFTGIKSTFITNIHLNHMIKGAYFLPHFDNKYIDVNYTCTFLLQEAEEGGSFIFGGDIKNFTRNSAVMFNGGKVAHGVTKIKKGLRRSLIVFYNTPDQKINSQII